MVKITKGAGFKLESLIVGSWIAFAAAPPGAFAQVKHYRGAVEAVPASELLAKLEQGDFRGINIHSAFQVDRMMNDSTVSRGNYSRYTDAERAQFLDAVERIAREGADLDARTAAFRELDLIGRHRYSTAPQAGEVPQRLMRIYKQTTIRESKWAAISSLGEILRTGATQSEEIIELLVSLIKQPVTSEQTIEGTKQYPTKMVYPTDALDALFSACNAGVPTLRELYADRAAIPYEEARGQLEEAAENGFDPKSFELSLSGRQPCAERPSYLRRRG